MTYNFDPVKWYDNELYLIQSKLKTCKITQNEYDEAVETLDKKLEKMWERLDGTYQIDSDK
jgi:sulfur relay (sulfurtransferase) DsrF/TusC family protein